MRWTLSARLYNQASQTDGELKASVIVDPFGKATFAKAFVNLDVDGKTRQYDMQHLTPDQLKMMEAILVTVRILLVDVVTTLPGTIKERP